MTYNSKPMTAKMFAKKDLIVLCFQETNNKLIFLLLFNFKTFLFRTFSDGLVAKI